MLFWSVITIILILSTIWLIWKQFHTLRSTDWPALAAVITGVFAFFILLTSFCCWMSYIEFEEEFEIQREIYEQIEIADEDSILLVADIIEANAELARYKASNNLYGFASTVPDRVHDIVPIGVK